MITNRKLAHQLLNAVQDSGVVFAFLHGEDRLSAGELDTDIDLVVDRPAMQALKAIVGQSPEGLELVMTWDYDVGALTSFWTSSDGTDVVQLDLLFDPEGVGKYGLRTDRALEHAVPGAAWPRLAQADEATYLVVKRAVKGRTSEARSLLQMAHPPDDSAARALLSEAALAVLRQVAEQGHASPSGRHLMDWRRLLGRVTSPAGVVVRVHPGNLELGQELTDEWRDRFPRVHLCSGPFAMTRGWLLQRRVGVVIVVGRSRALPLAGSLGQLREGAVRTMSNGVRSRLGA